MKFMKKNSILGLTTKPLGALQWYMRTCVHAYMRTCVHAYMRTCVHAYMR